MTADSIFVDISANCGLRIKILQMVLLLVSRFAVFFGLRSKYKA